MNFNDSHLILWNVYGYNNSQKNIDLLEDITQKIQICKLLYQCENVVRGDMNVNDDWFDRCPPRGQNHNPNKLFHQFCHKHDIQDAWRHYNNNTIQFSCFQPNALHRSRLDYWLVSDSILNL